MSLLRPFNAANDLFRFNNRARATIEQDGNGYYLDNMAKWPACFSVQESADGKIMGYVMGKIEGQDKDWHGHVTAITVAPQYRRLGLARNMMKLLEKTSDISQAWFVDLYVRTSNDLAVKMYESMGYQVFRTVKAYYKGGVRDDYEDAYDMRRPCKIDTKGISIRNGGRHVLVNPEDCWP